MVYLPTTFVEEAFDPATLPINCELVVEADGAPVRGERHMVSIKAVPRQGLSTMYCMTNVMKFQQQYLNWQVRAELQRGRGGGGQRAPLGGARRRRL